MVCAVLITACAGGCGSSAPSSAPAPQAAATAITVCGLLRAYDNDSADIANGAAAQVSNGDDPVARRDAVLTGFDELIARTARHGTDVGQLRAAALVQGPELTADLVLGAQQAADELAEERAAFATLSGITDGDMTGRVGQFFNALEKSMSVIEPAVTDYASDELLQAFRDEPTCRFVIQL